MPRPDHNMRTLLARIPSDRPETPALRAGVTGCMAAAERLAEKRTQLERDGRLTPAGQRQELAEALKKSARDWRDARMPITDAKGRLDQMRAALKSRPVADPTDIVGEMKRAELRAAIAEMPEGQRASFVLASEDPQIIAACLDQPQFVSGLPADVYGKLKAAYVQRANARELEEIEALQTAVTAAETGTVVARNELAQISGFEPRQFNEIVQPIIEKQRAPWLVDGGRQVVIVEPDGSATYRAATEDERRDGKTYRDVQEYRQEMAA